MKKKILLFVLAFAMIFTSLVSVAHAEDGDEPEGPVCGCPIHNPDYVAPSNTCEGTARKVNVASKAELFIWDNYLNDPDYQADNGRFWMVTSHMDKLVDGDWHQGTLAASRHATAAAVFKFNETTKIDEIVFVVNSFGQGSGAGGGSVTSMSDKNYWITARLYAMNEQDQEVEIKSYSQQASADSQTVTCAIDSEFSNVTKVVVEWAGAYTIWNVLWEVEMWSIDVYHVWELANADTPATCTQPGVGDYACACGATNNDQPIPATGHIAGTEWFIDPAVPAVEDDPATDGVDESAAAIPEKHYNKCIGQDCTEKMNLGEHNYSAECDLTCNTCAATREATGTHTYNYDCQTKCNSCDFVRSDAVAHTVDHACDVECNTCFEEIAIEHVYTDCTDTICNSANADDPTLACGYERVAPGHTWDNICDNECNACGAANPDYVAGHTYDNCDDTVCNECEFERTALAHVYDDCDDTGCNTCGMTRTAVAHTYDNACDANCNTCNKARTPADHVYDNACDATCNVCNAARTPADHVYDNACDKTCNVCNAERTVADHAWGEWAENADELEERACANCGVKETREPEGGLGGGAIAGIVIGSVAVVGGGGFAAWWFIFKKKAI